MRYKLKFLTVFFLMFCSSCHKDSKQFNQLSLNFQEGDVGSLHPYLLEGHRRGRVIGKLLYEGLTRIDEKGNPSLANAKNVEVSPDGLKYLFSLRQIHWSDGSPVTAEDYVRSWTHALNPKSDCPRSDLFYIIKNGRKAKKGEISIGEIGVQAASDSQLAVTLEYPSSHFLKLLAQPIFSPLKKPESEPTTFNGPFIVKNWQKSASIRLMPNAYFWNRQNVVLNQIDIEFITDPMTAFYMYEKKEIDWIGAPLSPLPLDVASKLIAENRVLSSPVDRVFWIYLNTNHPLLKSKKVRKSLALSVKRQDIIDHIFVDGSPLNTPLPLDMVDMPKKDVEPENRTRARQLFLEGLTELGFTMDHASITLSYSNQAGRKQLAEYLKNTWESALGLKVHLQAKEWNVFRQDLERKNFEIAGCLESSLYNDPLELMERFEELENWNFSSWENADFKEKIAEIRKENSYKERERLLVDAEKILMDEMPFIPLFRSKHLYSHDPTLKNYIMDQGGTVDFSYALFEKTR
jgi:oligopeptide transport system substrate-binding protein